MAKAKKASSAACVTATERHEDAEMAAEEATDEVNDISARVEKLYTLEEKACANTTKKTRVKCAKIASQLRAVEREEQEAESVEDDALIQCALTKARMNKACGIKVRAAARKNRRKSRR